MNRYLLFALSTLFLLPALTFGQDEEKEVEAGEWYRGKMRLWHNFTESEITDIDAVTGLTSAASKPINLVADQLLLGDPTDQGPTERFFRGFGTAGVLFFSHTESANKIVSHEFGHVRSFEKFGFDDIEFLADKDQFDADTNGIWQLWQEVRKNPSDIFSTTASSADWTRVLNTPEYLNYGNEFLVSMYGSGLNQNQYNAETMIYQTMEGDSHILEFLSYHLNASATRRYDHRDKNSDIRLYETNLEKLGVEADLRDLRTYSQLPKYLGNTHLSFLRTVLMYTATGEKRVEPISFGLGEDVSIYWPDFASYLTLHGPTLKLFERINWKEHAFTFTYEQAFADSTNECGLLWDWKVDPEAPLSLKVKVVKNLDYSGRWIELQPEAKIFSWLSVGLKFYHGKGYTFNREVVGNSYHFSKDREMGLKGFLEIRFDF